MSVADTLYTAFQNRDYSTMQSCYHEEAEFQDPAFGKLSALQTKAMWHMLCKRANDLKISYQVLTQTDTKITVRWIAEYTYSNMGHFVQNEITATLELKDGLIYRHSDEFSLWKWSRQALGLTGWYLGWTPLMRKTIRRTVLRSLQQFIDKNEAYQPKD